ncbi:EAL domain-containing protein [Vibrio sp. 2-Bac 85]
MAFFENLLDRYEKNGAILTLQLDGTILEVNQYYLKMLNTTTDNTIGKNIKEFDLHLAEQGISTLHNTTYGHYHSRLLTMNANTTPVEVVFFRRHDQTNVITLFIKNLSYLDEAKHALSFLSKMYREYKEAVLVTDASGYILCANDSFSEITGYSSQEVLGKTPAILKSGKQDKHFYRKFWQELVNTGSWHGEIWNKRKNGEVFPEWLNVSCLKDDNDIITHYICQFNDITTLKKSIEEKKFHTYYDSLTCLPNRRLLFEKLAELQKSNVVKPAYFAVLCCDLDRFKMINDTYGHHVGDELLKCIANRFERRLRDNDILARSGDDEFVVVIEGEESLKNIDKITAKLLTIFDRPFLTGYGQFKMSISIGISQFPVNSTDLRELISFADVAMQKVKRLGGNQYAIFDSSEKQLVRQQHLLEQDIKVALSRQEFEVWYQPQINSITNQVYGVECLLRWKHYDHGIISPNIFIPILESNGMMKEVGDFVIETACMQVKKWQNKQKFNGIVAINVSLRQLDNEGFVSTIENILNKYQIEGCSIELEVTESLFSENNKYLIPTLHKLRALGIKLSIDDFGTGYSSLQRLKTLPVDNVKIDKCFIDNIVDSEKDLSIINALILLSKTFKFGLVAEGIESKQQADCLNRLGCFNHQGFLYSKPLRINDFETLLDDHKVNHLHL